MGKQLSLIIVPHDENRTWNLRLSYRLLYTLVALLVIGLICAIAFMFTYGQMLVAAERAAMLGRENNKLKHQVAQVNHNGDTNTPISPTGTAIKPTSGTMIKFAKIPTTEN